jgi:hypothetical protein
VQEEASDRSGYRVIGLFKEAKIAEGTPQSSGGPVTEMPVERMLKDIPADLTIEG